MPSVHPDLLAPSDLPVTFGRYTLLGILGEGAMARVFDAELLGQGGFRKRAAVKVIHAVVAGRGIKLREALYQEARLGGLLHHPNVVETYDFGETDGHPWIAMELVDGVRLDQLLLRYGRLPADVVLEVGAQVCAGLAHAHGLVVDGEPVVLVHRDLKPPNVMISRDGLVKVMDFGIAKATRMQGDSTEAGQTKGTPAYMSPEQCTATVLDGRSDLFAAGALLFEMSAGRPFFGGESVYEVMAGVLQVEERLARPRSLDPADSWVPGLGEVIHRCLRADREMRFSSAADMERAVRAIQARRPPCHPLRTWLRQVLDDPTDEIDWGETAASVREDAPAQREAPSAWATPPLGAVPAMGGRSPDAAAGERSGPAVRPAATAAGERSGPAVRPAATTAGERSGPAVRPAAVRAATPGPALRPAAPVRRSASRPPPPERPTSPLAVAGVALSGIAVLALAVATVLFWGRDETEEAEVDGGAGEVQAAVPVKVAERAPAAAAEEPQAGRKGRSKADVLVEPEAAPSAGTAVDSGPAAHRASPSPARTSAATPTATRVPSPLPRTVEARGPSPTPRAAKAGSTPVPASDPAPSPAPVEVRLLHEPPAAALVGSPNKLSVRVDPASAPCTPVALHGPLPPGPEGYYRERFSPAGGGAWEASLFIPYEPRYRGGFRYRLACVAEDGSEIASWPRGGGVRDVPARAR